MICTLGARLIQRSNQSRGNYSETGEKNLCDRMDDGDINGLHINDESQVPCLNSGRITT